MTGPVQAHCSSYAPGSPSTPGHYGAIAAGTTAETRPPVPYRIVERTCGVQVAGAVGDEVLRAVTPCARGYVYMHMMAY